LNIEADKKPIPVQPFQTRLHSFQEWVLSYWLMGKLLYPSIGS
jgi:hypothetical protein